MDAATLCDHLGFEMLVWSFALIISPGSALAADIPHTPHGCREGLRAYGRPQMPNRSSLASELYPLMVWYNPDHANSVLIAPLVLQTLEEAWEIQVEGIGFRPPVLPDLADGPAFDVYLVDYAPFAAFVAADSYNSDPVIGDGYNSASSFMVIDHNLPEQAVPSYVSHEFNHACQYATDFSEPTLPIWEATATAAQKWTVGEQGYWQYDVPSFQEIPTAPVLVGDSYTIYPLTDRGYTFEYGAAMWVIWLDESYGDGAGAGGRLLWERAANEGLAREPDAVDAFASVTGSALGEALNRFAIARFLTGKDWDPRGIEDANAWGGRFAVPAYPLTSDDLPLRDFDPDIKPMITGQLFFDLDLTDGIDAASAMSDPWLAISLQSQSGLESGLAVSYWESGIALDSTATGAAPIVEIPVSPGLVRVVVAVTNLGPLGWDGEADPYITGDQRLTIDLFDRAVSVPEIQEPETIQATLTGNGCSCGGTHRFALPWFAWLPLGWAFTARRAAAQRTGA